MKKELTRGKTAKLELWQSRLKAADRGFSSEVERMDAREKLYNGDNQLKPLVPGDTKRSGGFRKTSHVRNIVFENIESQVSSAIPRPKVTPKRKKDEHLASVIEHFLRNELDRLPFERLNDLAERTVPIQGGVGFLLEWDNAKRTHDTVGEAAVSLVHPKQFAPQPGVYTGVQDMDWFIVKVPTTRQALRRKYGVDVGDPGEAEPGVRSADGESPAPDAVTQYIGFARGADGCIDRYSWVGDVELEDLEDYQARRQPVCEKCGRVRPLPGQVIHNADPASGFAGGPVPTELAQREAAGRVLSQLLAEDAMTEAQGGLDALPVVVGAKPAEPQRYDGGPCPWCGCEKFTSQEQEFEQVLLPIHTASGLDIPGMHPGLDENGHPALVPTQIPFYKPDLFPIVLQRSVSVYGKLLGNSDVDVIADQQNTVNRLEQKIIDRLMKAGTRITLPLNGNLSLDAKDGETWYLKNPADKALIDVYQFSGDLQYELTYLASVYEEARQILGITDSFQGRRDTTATSGKAKEFSAAQAAGRLESKRRMKDAAYAELYELMFKFWLAYSDEPRPVTYKDSTGETQYESFDRYDFLEQDEDGNYWWNDQFLFSVDSAEPLATNREAMWNETWQALQAGGFGNPERTETLILFWAKMEELHYPGAAATKSYLEDRLEREISQAAQTQQAPAQIPTGFTG